MCETGNLAHLRVVVERRPVVLRMDGRSGGFRDRVPTGSVRSVRGSAANARRSRAARDWPCVGRVVGQVVGGLLRRVTFTRSARASAAQIIICCESGRVRWARVCLGSKPGLERGFVGERRASRAGFAGRVCTTRVRAADRQSIPRLKPASRVPVRRQTHRPVGQGGAAPARFDRPQRPQVHEAPMVCPMVTSAENIRTGCKPPWSADHGWPWGADPERRGRGRG